MLRLRPYKAQDAETIASWCRDEESLRKWSSDCYKTFPVTAKDINERYIDRNGDCKEADNFYAFTAFDEDGIAGHLIMRCMDEKKTELRFGFVIVDIAKRGKGYGKELINLSLKYAFNIFKAQKVSLGVFDSNPQAFYCYRAAGFVDTDRCDVEFCGKKWVRIGMEITAEDFAAAKQND